MSRLLRASLLGIVIGASGPFLLAIKAWQELGEYAESVRAEGREVCGVPGLFPLVLLFVVTPVGGLLGGVLGPCVAWLLPAPRSNSWD